MRRIRAGAKRNKIEARDNRIRKNGRRTRTKSSFSLFLPRRASGSRTLDSLLSSSSVPSPLSPFTLRLSVSLFRRQNAAERGGPNYTDVTFHESEFAYFLQISAVTGAPVCALRSSRLLRVHRFGDLLAMRRLTLMGSYPWRVRCLLPLWGRWIALRGSWTRAYESSAFHSGNELSLLRLVRESRCRLGTRLNLS